MSGNPQPPAILFVLPHLAFGGAERLATFIIRHLGDCGLGSLVVEASQEPGVPNSGEDWFVPICPLHRLDQAPNLSEALLDLVDRESVSVVVICGRSRAYGGLPRLAGARPDLRVVSFQFNAEECIAENRRYAPYLDAIIAESLDAVMALCGGDEGRLPIHIIPSGVEMPAQPGTRLHAAPDRPLCVGYIGRFDRTKNPEGFVAMVRHVCARDLRFVMAGPGRRIRSAPAIVEQLGQLTDAALHALMDEIDILVVPSRADGRPMVIQEAQARCIAVIASRVGGIPELIDHMATGLLCPPGDPRSFADAVDRLVGDAALRRRLAEAGLQRVRREGDIRAALPHYLAAITGEAASPPVSLDAAPEPGEPLAPAGRSDHDLAEGA